MRSNAGVLCSWWALSLWPAVIAACGGDDPPRAAGAPGGSGGQPDGGAPEADTGLPDVAPTPCDFHAQDCAAAAEKCSIVQQPNGYAPVCVRRGGEKDLGQDCQRTALGYDDCATGTLCSPVAVEAGSSMVCRTICDATLQCSAPARCYRFSLSQPEVYGMCVPECRFFETDCGPNRHCLLVADAEGLAFPICDDHGAAGEGAACANANDCGKDMACARVSGIANCRRYCNPLNPCPLSSDICNPLGLSGFPGLGVCVPP